MKKGSLVYVKDTMKFGLIDSIDGAESNSPLIFLDIQATPFTPDELSTDFKALIGQPVWIENSIGADCGDFIEGKVQVAMLKCNFAIDTYFEEMNFVCSIPKKYNNGILYPMLRMTHFVKPD